MEETTPKKNRPGLFGPLFLILLGLAFLLSNLGMLSGSTWDLIIQFWPVLLILMSLDGIYRGEGLVGAAFMMGLGVVFLLANLGYLAVDVWGVVLRLWPVLLIAIGFDVMVGRKSRLGSLLGIVVVLAVLVGALWWMGFTPIQGQAVSGEAIHQNLDGAQQARVILDPAAGSLRVTAMDSQTELVSGQISEAMRGLVRTSFSQTDGKATYSLRRAGGGGIVRINNLNADWSWDMKLTSAIPLELHTSLGAGESLLDLTALQVTDLEASLGVGQITVNLPAEGRLEGQVSAAIGQIVIIVPEGVGLRIETGTALVSVEMPDGYSKDGSRYTSPDYAGAETQVDLDVSLAIGSVQVRQAER